MLPAAGSFWTPPPPRVTILNLASFFLCMSLGYFFLSATFLFGFFQPHFTLSLDFKALWLTVSGWHQWEEEAVWVQEADGACGWDA